ncbi:biliverdin-producing heme oxygenase [Marinobacter salicampi]|uniref:biliverdin-producing heme oxygenase n=1 Tax=Marinobacter salicampi TaxID=435907 RepID=UPI00140B1C10|nr:biliverdin-producing heme oxygenase [Marinobacter salicampi]
MKPAPQTPGSLHLRLRQATQQAHLDTERHPLLASLLRPDLDRAAYCRVLQAFRSFYLAYEPGLDNGRAAKAACQSLQYQYQPRAQLLADDLQDLGETGGRSQVYSGTAGFAVQRTPENILGWLYVLEGATQGGKVIGPNVSRALGVDETFGARYFHLYTLNQWRLFLTLMEQCQAAFQQPLVIEGALAAFEHLRTHLDAWSIKEEA